MARMIIARFQGLSKDEWPAMQVSVGSLGVHTLGFGHDGDALHLLLACEATISAMPDANSKGELVPDDDVRRHLEERLEMAVDAISVSNRAPRSIRSPEPCLGFIADDDSETLWLNQYRGIIHVHGAYPAGRPRIPLSALQALSIDRPDGIALLAEALAHPHPSGRFHEFFRVFERGFRTSCGSLGTPLTAFLSGCGHGYTRPEVDEWIDKRGPITHADRRSEFLRERDAVSLIHRMEQAAFDVVINKSVWRNSSTGRTERWSPDFGTSNDHGGVFVTQGKDANHQFYVLDQFGVYPFDLKVCLSTPPPGWWIKGPTSDAAA